ncbi:MAG TPA: SDR family NAD(P)-dependent oxidoreductase [Candidatus Binatia bacterium]|nr:SDR family NAD(P)-dependent oxidoreductase [Candidatus Binatia bacterium]
MSAGGAMAGRLVDKVALLTGGGSGIGEATAKRFAAEGAQVVIVDINDEAADRVGTEIRAAGGTVSVFCGDIAQPKDVEAMVQHAQRTFGRLDIVHNNATSGDMGYIADLNVEAWTRTIAINLTGYFLTTRAALPVMIAQGGGVFVNMASPVALSVEQGLGAYAAAKAGVISLTRSVAVEYARHNIRANCILPGAIATPPTMMFATAVAGARERMINANPMRRLGQPKEVANLVLFLAGDESSFITGAAHFVDGGAMATHNIGLMGGDA